ncbi:alpha/beta fold hydrolase [Nocardia altamirensis]|uniref:alpha/beta fold hydrolase n=1 Tax=Nocardia altamirensis TaxID=472158 RepID=UPI001FDFC750|nr:alpha/beta hydrolase [Nocardia altamirensis]
MSIAARKVMVSRRRFAVLAGVVLASAGVAAADGPAAFEVTAVRIPTAAGVFDAVAAGPVDGREVLLLHGFPELGIEWEHQLLALAAAGYRAVAPDQRGYSAGVRPGRVEEYQLDYPVADVLAIADALGWKRFDLVGHDWGAVVAWIAAAEHPERVRSLTAVSVPHPAAFAAALRTDPAQQGASKYMDFFRQPAPIPENKILADGPPELAGVPAARSAEYYRRLAEPGALTAALNWYRANDFHGYERPVAVPTLFLAATDDPMVAMSGIQATAAWVTGPYRLDVLAGAGHTIPERAAAETSARLLDHLSSVPR